MKKIAVLGLGLIGASLSRMLRERKLFDEVAGYDLNPQHAHYVLKSGFIDHAVATMQDAVYHAHIVVLAVPLSALEDILQTLSPHLLPGCILTDTTAVKTYAVKAVIPFLPKNTFFIPAHPIAGSEKTGPQASMPDIFTGKQVILSPEKNTPKNIITEIENLWRDVGAQVEYLSADTHDFLYAHFSHLPHLLAFACADTLENISDISWQEPILMKFLRIASSSPAMWAEIFIANSRYILPALDNFSAVLTHLIGELLQGVAKGEVFENSSITPLLYAHIIASSLITIIADLEDKTGRELKNYAGGGFTDFTSPAFTDPEESIQFISTHYRPVAALLASTLQRLETLKTCIQEANIENLTKVIDLIQKRYKAHL